MRDNYSFLPQYLPPDGKVCQLLGLQGDVHHKKTLNELAPFIRMQNPADCAANHVNSHFLRTHYLVYNVLRSCGAARVDRNKQCINDRLWEHAYYVKRVVRNLQVHVAVYWVSSPLQLHGTLQDN